MCKHIKFLFVALFLLNNAVRYASCTRLNIIPLSDSPCPSQFIEEPCLTLQQYVANSSTFSHNITLELYPGQHHVNSRLSVSNTISFIMRAVEVNAASVICSQSSYFSFNRFQHVYISNVTFIGCRMNLNSMMNTTFARNSFVNSTGTVFSIGQSSVQIQWCIFFSQTSTYRAISVSSGNTTLLGCNISGFGVAGRGHSGGAVTIYGGRAHICNSNFSNNAADGYGGAVYMQYGEVTISNCYFSNNAAGGRGYGGDAIYCYGASVTISNNLFTDNTVSGAVGIGRGNLSIDNSNFSSNGVTERGYGGGAVDVNEGRMTITNCCFMNNTVGGHGGAVYLQYGEVTINNCYFSNNSAGGRGYGGDAIYAHSVSVTITNSLFIDNTVSGAVGIGRGSLGIDNSNFSGNGVTERGYGGGAVDVSEGEARLIINNCCFTNNTVGGHGGAIYMQLGREMTINNSYFSDNRAPGRGYGGGAIFVYRVAGSIIMNSWFSTNRAGGYGGAVYVSRGDMTVTNSFFLDNAAGYSGADVNVYEGGVDITNSYFSDNAVGGHRAVYVRYGVGITISKSYFCDNTTETNSGHSRAIYIQASGDSISVTNNTFMKRASGAGSTPISYGGSYTSISLTDNTINYNTTAAYCGVLDVDQVHHCCTGTTLATIPQGSMYHTCMQTNNNC